MFTDVLIVDDERDIRELIAEFLEEKGYTPRVAPNSDQALREISLRRPSLVLLDVKLKGSALDGHEILQLLLECDPELPVIMMSGQGGVDMAVRSIQMGAYDYIEKPINLKRLLTTIEMADEKQRLTHELSELRRGALLDFELIGSSAPMLRLKKQVEKIAPTNSRIFITGPIGAGKQRVARLIHAQSHRAGAPLLTLNVQQSDTEDMRKILFGHENEDGQIEAGIFERAHMGTLYLEEVSDLSEALQEEVLRVLTEGRFQRVGGKQKIKVDVRIISSSTLSGEVLLKNKLLREDLYYRLNVIPVELPSLAARREDIPQLIDYFITELAPQLNVRPRTIGPDAMAVLQAHDWPGNARQLRNVVELILITSSQSGDDVLSVEALPAELLSDTRLPSVSDAGTRIIALPLRDAREVFEREYLTAQIARFSGNISRTAEFIGMERSALHRKLKSLGVPSNTRMGQFG